MSYKLTVGLEIHARLNTKTKMFCACVNENFDTRPNTNICPICTAQPGQLPQLNQEAVNLAIRLALALNAKLSSPFRFDRKSYFYPDNPKGFQITQFATPILRNGSLEIETKAGVKNIHILEAHLEDDAGKLVHEGNNSLVDLNRAGCPLIEIVTAPDFNDLIEVDVFLKELQKLLRYLSVSEADMEKGMLRVDVNISVSKDENLGQRIEIKNMNSFSEIMKAIAYEQKRQGDLLEQGIKIEPETRGWDVNKGQSFLQRSKENAADYRYFP
ncbi:MAG TPA: Asp-tRNA(Asn)/Glu-tRNA(Gln) amidotransferase subunit GatB, partial [Candidatus Gracilibacteria bacterium]|nr:Asp-tRNA(Asn)/Glu-tRNA(Gln) amidotransferase subunit GatB [Candidatus Gracilibacteria bacterium]